MQAEMHEQIKMLELGVSVSNIPLTVHYFFTCRIIDVIYFT